MQDRRDSAWSSQGDVQVRLDSGEFGPKDAMSSEDETRSRPTGSTLTLTSTWWWSWTLRATATWTGTRHVDGPSRLVDQVHVAVAVEVNEDDEVNGYDAVEVNDINALYS
jgi:hypothetical protein